MIGFVLQKIKIIANIYNFPFSFENINKKEKKNSRRGREGSTQLRGIGGPGQL